MTKKRKMTVRERLMWWYILGYLYWRTAVAHTFRCADDVVGVIEGLFVVEFECYWNWREDWVAQNTDAVRQMQAVFDTYDRTGKGKNDEAG